MPAVVEDARAVLTDAILSGTVLRGDEGVAGGGIVRPTVTLTIGGSRSGRDLKAQAPFGGAEDPPGRGQTFWECNGLAVGVIGSPSANRVQTSTVGTGPLTDTPVSDSLGHRRPSLTGEPRPTQAGLDTATTGGYYCGLAYSLATTDITSSEMSKLA